MFGQHHAGSPLGVDPTWRRRRRPNDAIPRNGNNDCFSLAADGTLSVSSTRQFPHREENDVMPASDQRTARFAGLWLIGTFVFSIPALLLYDPVLNDTNYVFGDGLDARISLAALLEILTAICNIATAVVLFRVVKRVSESVALGYVALRIVESTMILTGVLSLMSVVTLRDDLGGADGSVGVAGHTLVALHDWTFLLGPQLCAGFGTGLLLGYLMYKSELVPRRMAMLGLIGGPLAFVGGVFVLFGAFEQPSAPLFAFTANEIAWELSLALYLTFKGCRPSSRLLETEPFRADRRGLTSDVFA
jgi:hypothetical protein